MSPARLRALQDGVQAYLLGGGDPSDIRADVVDDARVGADQRLRIYHDAYRLRLIEALSAAYPNLLKLLGEVHFERISQGYIEAHPSRYRNLRWYGESLAEHLLEALPEHPIASELARFEWTLALAFDSCEAPLLTRADLAAIPPDDWGGWRLKAHPSVYLLDLELNTVAVWKALEADQPPPPIERSPASWLIWRHGLDPHFRSLEPAERDALAQVTQGARFSDICEALGRTMTEAAAVGQAAGYLAGWLDAGLLTMHPTPTDGPFSA